MITIDTRSYKEIYDSLDSKGRSDLTSNLMKDLSCSDSTLRNYRLNNRNPHPPVQKIMVKTIRRVTGINASAAYLFPESSYAKSLRQER